MSLNVIMLGPPASGKGTQAVRLAQARGIPKISTGDILREAAHAGDELGLKAKALMDRGELVSDEVMIDIVRERLRRPDAIKGFILDGFPRTVAQAETLDRMLNGDALVIINLAAPDAELIHRMEDRRVCVVCGRNAEPETTPSDVCARCGGQMIMRADDGDANVRQHRLEVYARESKPLLDYYRDRPTFRSINGAQSPERVAAELGEVIDAVLPAAVRARGQAGSRPL
jgi:adenylate kinase